MSWGVLGNIGNAIKKGVTDVGHFVGKAASNPIVEGALALTPLGIPASIAAGAVGGLLKPGGNLGQAASGAAKGGASGVVGSAIGKIPGVGSAVGSVLGGANDVLKNIPGVSSVEQFLKDHNIGGDIAGALKSLGGAAGLGTDGSSFDPSKLAMMGLAGLQIKNNADLASQSNAYAKQALSSVQDNYNARAPLRTAGMEGMLNPKIQDLSSLLSNSGPYAKGILPGLGKAPTVGMKPVASFT